MKVKSDFAIIVPCHNEEKNLDILIDELHTSLKDFEYDLIFIDDGSKDQTWQKIQTISKQKSNIIGIKFSRNFGHQSALEAGLKISENYKFIISMDADLQHPPSVIPELIKLHSLGYEIVNTMRKDNENISFFKKVTSQIFYKFLNKLAGTDLHQGSSDFRLLDKKVVKELNNFPEKEKFYRGLVNWIGYKCTFVRFDVRARKFGESSYTIKKMLRFALNGILSFSVLPMRVIFLFGITLVLLSMLLMIIIIISNYILKLSLFTGTSLLLSFILLNNGVVISFIGILALYQTKMYQQLQDRPNFIVSERVN